MFDTTSLPLKISIFCGILAPIIYICIDIFGIISWEEYNWSSQSISDLIAIGSPVRHMLVVLLVIYNILILIFGIGVVIYDPKNRYLQIIGCLLIGNAIFDIGGMIFPKYLNETLNSPNNTKNTIVMIFAVLFLTIAIILGAFAFKNWFRYFSVGVIIWFVLMAILGFTLIPMINKGKTLGGIQERTMAYTNMLWIFLLAIALL